MLYIVATPIGNLEDMSLRAIRILGEVGLIAAEDTRKTRILLKHYQIKTKLTSYYEHSKQAKTTQLIDRLASGQDIALVSEAGMPGISDPGYELIAAAIENDIEVVPIPGPSAITTALVASGLPPSQFTYLGFLPRKKSDRKKLLESVAHITHTLIAYESPHRIKASLSDIELVLGNRHIAVCRELTKLHEEVFRGNVSDAIEHFENPRGEFTLVIEGATDEKQVDTGLIETELRQLKKDGIKAKAATAQISKKYGLTRNEVYNIWLSL
ncbi:MAG: 16S rRNA (cytidine(1402)-2'-O)-methyltransferase [Chloroflexi bacterium]|jgi:16S rRNA (cytidine1402-2'-O)-methyltransferase|nr:16S rRNA (cytidine(1402)-2'-O)-methyltransferase [Chloroflexota bacterium]MBT7081766.1 16S rRNA (cytidine(1402)-2'-O)-methyltransferase [Chloroflexota bacterium]MBT7289406.1 16S rRNA (cytidine(1402)-2'-O)-methyltransferase [Chloroflexota bacterium]